MTAGPGNRYRYLVGILVFFILIGVGVQSVGPGPLFPIIMQDFSIGKTAVGWTTSIFSLMMALLTIPAGILAARIGVKRAFAIGAFLASAAVLTPLCSNIGQLLATRIVFAMGSAILIPISGGVVMQWFNGKSLPFFNGLNLSGLPAGNAVALYTLVMFAGIWNWKLSLAIYGVIALIFAAAWLILGKERGHQTIGSAVTDVYRSISIAAVLKRRTTLLLGLSIAGPFLLFITFASWLPTYYTEVFHMPLARASSITGIFTLFSIPASILGGFLPLRTGLRRPFLIIPGFFMAFTALGSFLVNNLTIIYISIALFGILSCIYQPVIFTMAMELPSTSSPREASVVISCALAMGNLAGFTGPLLVGFLAERTGSYLPGLVIASVLSLTMFIAGLLLPETGPGFKRLRAAASLPLETAGK